jgi:hypothetical protein
VPPGRPAVIRTRPERGPAGALWRGGAVPALVVAAVVGLGSGLSGAAAGGSALLGAGLAAATLSTGPAIMWVVHNWSPPAVMASALTGYAVTVLAGSAVFTIAAGQPWLSGGHAAAGVVAVTLSWTAGQIRAVVRLRILLYAGGTQCDE